MRPGARDPSVTLRRGLLLASALCAALQVAWAALWLWMADHFHALDSLLRPAVLAYVAAGPLGMVAGLVTATRWPRTAGWLLTAGGTGAAFAIWLGRVPAFGAEPALWCTAVLEVALGAAWLAFAGTQIPGPRR